MKIKMRISFILSTLWLSGGVRDIIETANRLTQRGHRVSLIVSGGTVEADVRKEIAPCVEVREAGIQGRKNMGLFEMVRLTLSLAMLVPPSDVVISTQTPTTIAGLIATRLLRRGVPVWYYQDYLEMFLDRPILKWLCRNALRWNTGALVLSQYSKEELERFVSGKPITVSGVGLSGIEVSECRQIPSYHHLEDKKKVLFLGDMRPRKGWNDFWEAIDLVYKSHPEIEVILVSKETCEVNSKVPYRLIYRPTRSDLAKLYSNCDVFVLPPWWESFGIPGLEALACGAAMVMTDTRGGRDYAVPGENCLMVPIRSPVALAEGIVYLLEKPELANQFRHNGPITAARFNWEKSVDIFEQALFKFVGKDPLQETPILHE